MSQLSSYLCAQADWRRQKAEEYPEDERNARSASALKDLAHYVAELEEEGDLRARYLAQYHQPAGAETPIGGEETTRQLSRWGFHHSNITREQQDEFVSELCALAAGDAFEWVRDTRDDFTAEHVPGLVEQYGLTEADVRRALNDQQPSSLHFIQEYGSTERMARLIEEVE